MRHPQPIAYRKTVWVWLALVILSVRPTWVCMPEPDYYWPTNFELVQMAEAIVVATAKGEVPYNSDTGVEAEVSFQVNHAFKGKPPERFQTQAGLGEPVASDPVDLSATNDEWRSGGCIRQLFALNGQYVVFMSRFEGRLGQMGGLIGARINEDYFGENSLWVRVIRTYIEVQSLKTKREQIAALEGLLAEQRALAQTVETQAFAKDITIALAVLRQRERNKPD